MHKDDFGEWVVPGMFAVKMLLQVHDELVFDVLKDELEKVKPVILECMQHALALPNDVQTNAEIGVGENWLLAHYFFGCYYIFRINYFVRKAFTLLS